jgi:hypothetical protein
VQPRGAPDQIEKEIFEMASQTIAAHAAVIQFPLPEPARREIISQERLTHFKALQQRIEALEAEAKQLETALLASLEAGAIIEPGVFKAFLKTTERRNVSWKGVVERELGAGYAKRVLAATKPDTYTSVVVEA